LPPRCGWVSGGFQYPTPPSRTRGSLDRRAAEDAVQGAFRRCSQPGTRNAVARKRPAPGLTVLIRVQGGTLPGVIGEILGMRRRVACLRSHEGRANPTIAEHLGPSQPRIARPGTVAKHVSNACADVKKALPELAIADDPDGDLAGGEEAP